MIVVTNDSIVVANDSMVGADGLNWAVKRSREGEEALHGNILDCNYHQQSKLQNPITKSAKSSAITRATCPARATTRSSSINHRLIVQPPVSQPNRTESTTG